MSNVDVTRAWKDPLYRSTLQPEEISALPESPAGLMELNDESLVAVNGGTTFVCTIVSIIVISLTLTTCTITAKYGDGGDQPQS